MHGQSRIQNIRIGTLDCDLNRGVIREDVSLELLCVTLDVPISHLIIVQDEWDAVSFFERVKEGLVQHGTKATHSFILLVVGIDTQRKYHVARGDPPSAICTSVTSVIAHEEIDVRRAQALDFLEPD
jgi:hypothetical protein